MVQTLQRFAGRLADTTVNALLPKATANAAACVNCPSVANRCNYFCCGTTASRIHLYSCCMNSSLHCTCQVEIYDYC
ncbi:hypothetical protein [Nonomuraea guangzhouensis]|uniref:Uncharacterized protein n=1 Tax=Nonomuraea guangzhouensis TaxID=1291555 RepID=A0ABW4GCM1_9ACTN|nr:hypothetical protein [Nonomuraea guangzhouensis]